MDPKKPTAPWDRRLGAGEERKIFDHLPNHLYFVKNEKLQLISANRAFLDRCGYSEVEEIIGLTDRELFPLELAEKYRQDDLRVLESGQPLNGIIELFPNRIGDPEWFITDKIPLRDDHGAIIGLCGVVRSYERTRIELQPYLDLRGVVEYLKQHFAEPISMKDLASKLGISTRQLERRFRATFNTSPRQYTLKLRILKACELLAGTSMSVTEIALATGFYDHSAFSRRFRSTMNMTPADYRRRNSRYRRALKRPLQPEADSEDPRH
ncbi:PAS domain S-box-containing protein [Haloferula luteola]|uniref:PAS domain S-box-containing protein n=1 Tax=Haloferula luteola TaxID=595692 RepID=A0A840V5M2_9BACT|nr:AraC family transcriptional regulator [Haloferula luteola]MBB5352326.1 PAS domain S-box-containing protein [Haloferula luteola]